MRMIERWKETLNKVGYVCAIFMDTLCTSGCNLEYILKKTDKVLTIDNGLLAVAPENCVKKLLKKYWFCQEYQTNVMNLKKTVLSLQKNISLTIAFFF